MNNHQAPRRFTFLLLLAATCAASAMQSTAIVPIPAPVRQHPTGWLPLEPAEQAALLREFTEIADRPQRSPLPTRWVNNRHLPPVAQGSQGQLGICGSICVTYFLATHQLAKARGWEFPGHAGDWDRVTSPAWGVWMFQHGTSGTDTPWGASPYGTIKSVIEHGIRSYQDYPFTASMDFTWRPPYEEMVAALAWRGLSGSYLSGLGDDSQLQALKQVLAGGDILVCTIARSGDLNDYPGNDRTTSQEVYYRQEKNAGDPHALTIVGYDDDKEYIDGRTGEKKRGALLLVNSWGANWGVAAPEVEGGASQGFIWIAYDFASVLLDVCTMTFASEPPEVTLVAKNIFHNFGDEWTARGPGGANYGLWYEHVSLTFANRRARTSLFSDYNTQDLGEQDYLHIPIDVSELAALRFPTLRLGATSFVAEPAGEVSLTFHPFALPHDTPLPPQEAPLPVYNANGYLSNRKDISMIVAKTLDFPAIPSSGSASQADVDGDGLADLVVSFRQGGVGGIWGDQRTWLCRNDGAGGFVVTDLGIDFVGEVAWGDVNNDGHLDIIHSGQWALRPATILLNDGHGNFADSAIPLPSSALGGLAVADLDRDGRLDLILLNDTEGVLIMHQQPDGSFVKVTTGFAVAKSLMGSSWAIDCGDVNGDGLPDFAFTGLSETTSSYEARIRVALNRGNLNFDLLSTETPGLNGTSLALGDYDSDGRDDLAWSGGIGNAAAFGVMQALPDGSFKAADLSPDIAPVYRGRAAWIDIDNDGHRDLVIGGRQQDTSANPGTFGWYGDPTKIDLEGYFPNHTLILAHAGGNTFVESGLRLPGTMGDNAPSLLACLDLDGDHDADIFTAGCAGTAREWASSPGGAPAATTRTRTLTNRLEDIFSQQRPNLPPTAPITLAATVAAGSATFTWSGATDNATPENGLRYILAVGSTPGGNDVASGAVAPQMSGLLVRSGATLRNLPVGTLYWRVRTVDASLALSPWSAEKLLIVAPYTPTAVIELAAGLGGIVIPEPGRYSHLHGKTFSATAQPVFGYEFTGWTVDGQGVADNPLNLIVAGNHTINAHFAPSTTTLSSPDWIRHPVSGASYPWHEWGSNSHVALATGSHLYCFPAYGTSDETWISTNGDNWIYETFTPTYSFDAFGVVFNNRLWFMGGKNWDIGILNHVWSSSAASTGKLTWRREADAPWAGRTEAGCAVFDGKIWVVSGNDANWIPYADVWFTPDGANWTRGADVPWIPRRATELVVADGWLYALLGQTSASSPGPPEVWKTADGQTWQRVCASAPWGGFARHFSAAFFDNRLHVTSGPNQHWISPDEGVTWVQVRPNDNSLAHWDELYGAELVVFKNQLWLIGGEDNWALPAAPPGPRQATLTLAVSGHSSTNCTTSPPPGQYVDLADTDFPIAALPGPGYAFVGWGDSAEMATWQPSTVVADSTAAVTTVNLAASTTLVAIFDYVGEVPTVGALVPLAAAVHPPGTGSLAVPTQVPLGTGETIRATPAAGYEFSHWRGSAVVSPLLAQSAIVADHPAGVAVTACFRRRTGDLHASARNSMLRSTDGCVWLWGDDRKSLLGPRWQEAQAGLPAFAALTGISQIALANDAAFARQGANVWKWGAFSYPSESTPASPVPRIMSNKVHYAGVGYKTENAIVDLLAGGGAASAATLSQAGSSCLNTNEIYGTRMPFAIPPGSGRVAVSETRSLVLDAGGRLWRVGNQVDGYNENSNAPTIEHPGRRFAFIANSSHHHDTSFSLGLDFEGNLWSWGQNFWGQLGDGTVLFRSAPVAVALPERIVKVAAGTMHSLALGESGTVYAWGNNRGEMLGVGSEVGSSPLPLVVPGLPPIADIAAGENHSLALALDGGLYAWGSNQYGQASGRRGAAVPTPQRLDGLAGNLRSHAFTVAVRKEKPAARATDEGGPAGDGLGLVSPAPGAYVARAGAVVTLEAQDGERYLFSHWEGPVADSAKHKTFATVEAAATVTAVFRLRPDLPVQLAMAINNPLGGSTTPAPGVHTFPRGTRISLAAFPQPGWQFSGWSINGTSHAASLLSLDLDGDYAVTANYTLTSFTTAPIAWLGGTNFHLNAWGELVDSIPRFLTGTPLADSARYQYAVGSLATTLLLARDSTLWLQTGYALTPASLTRIPGGNTGSAFFNHAVRIAACRNVNAYLAARDDGTLWFWGHHPGDGTNVPQPTRLEGFSAPDLVQIVGGGNSFYLLHASGTVYSWGADLTGTGTVHPVPTPIPGLAGVTALAVGNAHILARRGDGTVWGWGSNAKGDLGQTPDTLAESAVPVQIPGLAGITRIFAGNYAVDHRGQVWCWGRDVGYSLGLGNDFREKVVAPPMIHPHVPSTITAVYLVNAGTLAVTSDGHLWCWGFNAPYTYKNYPATPMFPGRVGTSSVPDFSRPQRRLAVACDAQHAALISHPPGLHTMMDGDRVTLWGNPTILDECVAWMVDGVAVPGSHVDMVMDRDRSASPVYALIPPERRVAPSLAVGDSMAVLGEDALASVPILLEQGLYTTLEGFQFAVRIPHPLPAPDLRRPEALADTVELFTVSERLPNPDGTEDILLKVILKGFDRPFPEPEMTLLYLDFKPTQVPPGSYPLSLDTAPAGRGAATATLASGENGQFSAPVETANGTLTVLNPAVATLHLYVTPFPTHGHCLTPDEFANLPEWIALRNDQPAYAEIWLRCDERSLLDSYLTALTATANLQFQAITHFATAPDSRTGTLAAQQITALGGRLDDLEMGLLNALNPTPYSSGNWLRVARIALQALDAAPFTIALDQGASAVDIYAPGMGESLPPVDFTLSGTPRTVSSLDNLAPTANLPDEFAVAANVGFARLAIPVEDGNPQDVDNLFVTILSQPPHGRVAIDPESPTGLLFYPPDDGFAGSVQFDIAVGDGTATAAPQTVTVEILHQTTCQFNLGWHAFALPGQLAEPALPQVANDLGGRAAAVWIEPVGWVWNARSQAFATTDTIQPGQPCWLYVYLDGAATFQTRQAEHVQTWHPGWNAVCPAETQAQTPEMVACWKIANSHYVSHAGELQANHVYWILWQPSP